MELTEKQQELYNNLISSCIQNVKNKTLTEKEVDYKARQFASLPFISCDEFDIQKVVKYFLSVFPTSVDVGIALTEKNHTPWYMMEKIKKTSVFWNRYFIYLDRKSVV